MRSSGESPRSISFLSVDEALAIYQRVLDAFGGATGVRDQGLLESALFRPQTGYYADLAEMATALFESLISIHPFVDGNKRVAFFATDVFLRANGWRLDVEAGDAHGFLMELFEISECDFAHLLPWIQESLERLD